MYALVRETGNCDVVAALPRDAFLAMEVATVDGTLRVHLAESGAPPCDKPKRLHTNMPGPLGHALLWGAVYLEVVDGAGAPVAMTPGVLAGALAGMQPVGGAAAPFPLPSFAEAEDDAVAVEDEPPADTEAEDGSDDGSECDDGSDDGCDDALAVCEACNGEGCSNCAEGEADESEIEGE